MHTVLLVDDSNGFLIRMTALLEELDLKCRIVTAGTISEASEKVAAHNPKVTLLDINLPDKNGIRLLEEIRQREDDRKVIVMTNYSYDYYKEMCGELGVIEFLDKSTDFNTVPEIIAHYLN